MSHWVDELKYWACKRCDCLFGSPLRCRCEHPFQDHVECDDMDDVDRVRKEGA